jgi:secretion/DNA translocation related CpaE-like protein
VTGQHRPLVVTADAELLDDVLGVAAAVGVAVDVAMDPGACGPQWSTAPLVLIGGDVSATLRGGAIPRTRPGVLVVRRGGSGEHDQVRMAWPRAEDVVRLPADESVLSERLADAVEPSASGTILAVLPGRGGAGASVLAAALALTAADQADAWLIDLDPLGGGADAVLGAELAAGARWDDIGSLAGRVSAGALRAALPVACDVAILSAGDGPDDPAPAAVRAVLSATRRSGGTVVVDLPRRPGAALAEALSAADEVLLLVPADVRAVLAARQLLGRLGDLPTGLRVAVRRVPQGLPPDEVARALHADLVGDYADEPAVRAALLSGEPRGLVRDTELAALCHRILDGSAEWAEAS